MPTDLTTSDQANCYYPNSGAPTEIGGSDIALSVFTIGGPGTTGPPTGSGYLGCLSGLDLQDRPTFSQANAAGPNGALTQAGCKLTCADFKYFALTEGNLCVCDNSYSPDAVVLPNEGCLSRASGAPLEAAGGPTLLGVQGPFTAYENTDYVVRPVFPSLCSKLCSANLLFDPG